MQTFAPLNSEAGSPNCFSQEIQKNKGKLKGNHKHNPPSHSRTVCRRIVSVANQQSRNPLASTKSSSSHLYVHRSFWATPSEYRAVIFGCFDRKILCTLSFFPGRFPVGFSHSTVTSTLPHGSPDSQAGLQAMHPEPVAHIKDRDPRWSVYGHRNGCMFI